MLFFTLKLIVLFYREPRAAYSSTPRGTSPGTAPWPGRRRTARLPGRGRWSAGACRARCVGTESRAYGRAVQPTTDLSTRVNHNIIVYQYQSCTQCRCIVPAHSVVLYRRIVHSAIVLYHTHSVIRCRPISRRVAQPWHEDRRRPAVPRVPPTLRARRQAKATHGTTPYGYMPIIMSIIW